MLSTRRLGLIVLCSKPCRPPFRLRRRPIELKATQQNYILNLVGLNQIFEQRQFILNTDL